MARTQVFVSYAHVDNRWRKRVVDHLEVLAGARLIDIWDDQELEAGDDWDVRIHERMSHARIAVMLISTPFLNSDFIRNREVRTVFRKHQRDGMRVYPLLIRSCPWQKVKWLARMQLRPQGNKPVSRFRGDRVDEILTDVALEIAEMAKKGAAAKKVRKRVPKKSQKARSPERARPRVAKKAGARSTKIRTRVSKKVRKAPAVRRRASKRAKPK